MLVAIVVLCSLCVVLLGIVLYDFQRQKKCSENIKEEMIKSHDDFTEVISALILLIPFISQVSRKVEGFEQFFEDTLEDVSGVIGMLDNLMKRQTISDDPDVQNFYRVMTITHDVLLGYRDAKIKKERKNG